MTEFIREDVFPALDVVFRFVEEYKARFGVWPKLVILNRRYGVETKRATGRTVKTLLELDGRFLMEFDKMGATEVGLIDVFRPGQSEQVFDID